MGDDGVKRGEGLSCARTDIQTCVLVVVARGVPNVDTHFIRLVASFPSLYTCLCVDRSNKYKDAIP